MAPGNTIANICAVSGHSEVSATAILKHYLELNGEFADVAIANLVAHEEEQARRRESES